MKNTDKNREDRIEQTLRAMDGMERAKPKPFLYTRISARLENRVAATSGRRFLSPVVQQMAVALIMLVIILNIYTVTRFFTGASLTGTTATSEEQFIEAYYPSTPTLYNISQNVTSQ